MQSLAWDESRGQLSRARKSDCRDSLALALALAAIAAESVEFAAATGDKPAVARAAWAATASARDCSAVSTAPATAADVTAAIASAQRCFA